MQIHFSFLTKEGAKRFIHDQHVPERFDWEFWAIGHLAQPKPTSKLYKHFLQNLEADGALKNYQ